MGFGQGHSKKKENFRRAIEKKMKKGPILDECERVINIIKKEFDNKEATSKQEIKVLEEKELALEQKKLPLQKKRRKLQRLSWKQENELYKVYEKMMGFGYSLKDPIDKT